MARPARLTPLSLTLSYALLGGTWIVASDALFGWWSPDADTRTVFDIAKGLAFIGLTSTALYGWARRFHAGTLNETEALAQARARADQSRRMYATLSAVNRRIIRPTDRGALGQAICDALIAPGGLAAAWLGRVTSGDGVQVVACANCAPPPELRLADQTAQHARQLAEALRTGRAPTLQSLSPTDASVGVVKTATPARSAAAIRFTPHGAEPLLLVVYGRSSGDFTDDVMALLAELAADLQYGLESIADREARANAEEALRASEQRLASEVTRCRALLDVSVDAIQVTDLEGRLLEANEIFLRERGYRRDMIPNLCITNWNAELTPDQIRARLASFGPEPQLWETVHRRADGSTFAVEARSKRVEVDGRAMVYTTCRDISERRELEQRLLRSQRLESVGLIASGIAHDLNNVLTPILLSTGLLEMRYSAPEDEALLKPIEAAARRGSNIVQQILTFARGAEGQRVAVEAGLLLKELTNLIRETFPRNIGHQLSIAADAWPLLGDPTQLHQVLLNLAVNARDAMPAGGTLSISVANRHVTDDYVKHNPAARRGEFVCIRISDTGTGMTPDVLDHLFEPFFTTKPRGRGTGLGLSTVHGLVRSHGGFVEVDSKLGRGSEFRVFLPAALRATALPAPEKAPPSRPGRGEHILITDDEPAILSVLSSVLKRNGFVPLTALDGAEALAVLERHRANIAVVITDVMMPKFDGVRLAAEVRQRYPGLPVIAMSGMISPAPDDDSRQQLRDLGVAALLDKPYAEPDLLKALGDALHGRDLVPE